MSRIVDVLMSRAAFAILSTLAVAYCVYDVSVSVASGIPVRCWNWPNITITGAIVLVLYLARRTGRKMREALHELWLQGTLPQVIDPTAALQERILKGSVAKEWTCAVLFMLTLIAAFAWSEGPFVFELVRIIQTPGLDAGISWKLIAASAVASAAVVLLSGILTGAFFGRLAAYGSMASVLADPQTKLNIRPAHFDGTNGLKPVGDFYLFSALLTAVIPLIWLAGWALALSWYTGGSCYAYADVAYTWRVRWQFLGQWLVLVSYTYYGFVRPVFALRHRQIEKRDDLVKNRLPQIGAEIARLKGALAGTSEDGDGSALEARIYELAREHAAIRNMNCWPMDKSTLHKYAPVGIVTNLAPPLIGSLLSSGGPPAAGSGWLGGLAALFGGLF